MPGETSGAVMADANRTLNLKLWCPPHGQFIALFSENDRLSSCKWLAISQVGECSEATRRQQSPEHAPEVNS